MYEILFLINITRVRNESQKMKFDYWIWLLDFKYILNLVPSPWKTLIVAYENNPSIQKDDYRNALKIFNLWHLLFQIRDFYLNFL